MSDNIHKTRKPDPRYPWGEWRGYVRPFNWFKRIKYRLPAIPTDKSRRSAP